MSNSDLIELTRARREYVEAVKARASSTLPADALLAIASIWRMAPYVPPSHEYGKPRLTVVR